MKTTANSLYTVTSHCLCVYTVYVTERLFTWIAQHSITIESSYKQTDEGI